MFSIEFEKVAFDYGKAAISAAEKHGLSPLGTSQRINESADKAKKKIVDLLKVNDRPSLRKANRMMEHNFQRAAGKRDLMKKFFPKSLGKIAAKKKLVKPGSKDQYKAMSTDKSLMKKDDGSTVVQMPELESDAQDYQRGY